MTVHPDFEQSKRALRDARAAYTGTSVTAFLDANEDIAKVVLKHTPPPHFAIVYGFRGRGEAVRAWRERHGVTMSPVVGPLKGEPRRAW